MSDNKKREVTSSDEAPRSNFIRAMIDEDLKTGKYDGRVVTRFPPEPNGYLHIGHTKAIALSFGLAEHYGGVCHLRFDDTNPASEDVEYVESIKHDIKWLGFDWHDKLFYTSDYFERLYDFAVELIEKDLAYVDSLNEEEIREYRGSVKEHGRPSPYRGRTIEENLTLFKAMKDGEYEDGEHVLRAKIDLASPNMKMRDPLLYRIRKGHSHYRRGTEWCIYPMYDFAHCLSDAIEGITHSLCTLEFENNREIYDWLLANVELAITPPPEQTEFARLSISYFVMSKRKLLQLVTEKHVMGWDDPRMPTVAGMRRRGYTPESLRDFAELVGVAKANSVVEYEMLEYSVRNDLNFRVPRVMCVLDPLKVVIENFPEGEVEDLDASYYPHDIPKEGSRSVPFSREIYIERDDFMEEPSKGFRRLVPGGEVRLRHAYVVKCTDVIKNDVDEIVELRCTYDPETKGKAPEGRKVKGAIHWVSAEHGVPVEVRVYDRLFSHAAPDSTDNFLEHLNPDSLHINKSAVLEPSVINDPAGSRYQFERLGYYCSDIVDSSPEHLVFNRTVALRDSWSKKQEAKPKEAKAEVASSSPSKKSKERPQKKSRAEIREKLRSDNPELMARFERYQKELGLTREEADVLTGDREVAAFFEAALATHDAPRSVANWFNNELLRELKDRDVKDLLFNADAFGALVSLVDKKTISGKIAKQVFAEMMEHGGHPETIVEEKGLKQITDPDVLAPIIANVLAEHSEPVERFKGGEKSLLGFFVGQVMKATRGQANPKLVNQLLREQLKS